MIFSSHVKKITRIKYKYEPLVADVKYQCRLTSFFFLPAPGKVHNLTIEDVQAHSLTISWLPPTENRQCLKGYILNVFSEGISINLATVNEDQTTHTVTSLQGCTMYNISMASKGNLLTGELTSMKQETKEEGKLSFYRTSPPPLMELHVKSFRKKRLTRFVESLTLIEFFLYFNAFFIYLFSIFTVKRDLWIGYVSYIYQIRLHKNGNQLITNTPFENCYLTYLMNLFK